MNKWADYRQELRGCQSLTHCQYIARNNILQIVRRAGRPSRRPGAAARARVSTRARCETGNLRQGAHAARGPRAPLLAPSKSYLQCEGLPPPTPVTFSPNRKKMKCRSSFAAGSPQFPSFGSRAWMWETLSTVMLNLGEALGEGAGQRSWSDRPPKARPKMTRGRCPARLRPPRRFKG